MIDRRDAHGAEATVARGHLFHASRLPAVVTAIEMRRGALFKRAELRDLLRSFVGDDLCIVATVVLFAEGALLRVAFFLEQRGGGNVGHVADDLGRNETGTEGSGHSTTTA